METEWPDSDGSGGLPRGFVGQMRTWLSTGARGFVVDPRRRLGKHGGARKMLASDEANGSGRPGAWQGLVAALQRHTVHGELAQLSKDDRQILSLAYLSGYTNREIAQMLQVSVRTVSRRLSLALQRLEESMRKAGMWVTVLLLLALAGYERVAQYVRTNRWPSTVALVAAGTATTVAAVTFIVAPPAVSGAKPSITQARVHLVRLAPPGEQPTALVVSTQQVTHSIVSDVDSIVNHVMTSTPVVTASRICHGNPTNAPPPTPVGPRGPGHKEPPVTQPGPGGCGHLNK